MKWFSRKVLVTFMDDVTGAAFAKTEMAPEDLPESFEIETTLHIGEAEWSVVRAEPLTRKDYTKSGSLVLRLHKVERISTEEIRYSQVDITEGFDDNLSLGADEWISTTPLNSRITNPELMGIPSLDADSGEVYRVASNLSALRESIPLPNDGVYCPICHIANIDLGKLRMPCPKCGREQLKFGWD